MLLFAVFVRYNKTPIGFIFTQYGKILRFDFNIGLDLRSRPILKSKLNILPYCAQKNPISYNVRFFNVSIEFGFSEARYFITEDTSQICVYFELQSWPKC